MLTDQQKEMRPSGVGSSDVAAIFGEHPQKSEFSLWLEKRGMSPKQEPEEPEDDDEDWSPDPMWLGNQLEPVLRAYWARREGIAHVTLPGMGQIVETTKHPTVPHFLDTPDGLGLHASSDSLRCMEGKTSVHKDPRLWGPVEYSDQFPRHYYLQCQWHLGTQRARLKACADGGWLDPNTRELLLKVARPGEILREVAARISLEVCDVPVMLNVWDTRMYRATFNPQMYELMCEVVDSWWRRHVLGGAQPQIDGSDQAKAWLKDAWPRDARPELSPAGPEDVALVAAFDDLKVREKELRTQLGALKSQLGLKIQDAAGLQLPDGSYLTWKRSKDSVGPDHAAALHLVGQVLGAAPVRADGSVMLPPDAVAAITNAVRAPPEVVTKSGSRKFHRSYPSAKKPRRKA